MKSIILEGPHGRREIPANTQYRLLPGEKVVPNKAASDPGLIQLKTIANGHGIGLGDLVAAITTSTGFKKWWEEKHGGECSTCNRRWAAYNYVRFKGLAWLEKWVIETLSSNPSGNRT